MSKKETRRAARQAFPELKNPAPSRSRYDTRPTRSTTRRKPGAAQGPKPPTLKRAAIQGAIVAALYFLFIQWIWKSGAATSVNLIFALGGFILYTGVAYWVDKFRYGRSLRKAKGQSK